MVAGGTGGHIYPALALAEALEKRGHELLFVGSLDRMEKDLIPAKGYKYYGLNVYSTMGGLFAKLRSLFSIFKAYFECLKLVDGYDMAIGFGNYISLPLMFAAKKKGLKCVLHEQNSFVGRANRLLDMRADLIIASYPDNLKQFRNPRTFFLGNPQASKAFSAIKDENIITDMGLDPKKKTVVIFMGSLGSESIMKVLLEYFDLCDGAYQIIYATGKAYYSYVDEHIKKCDYLKYYERIDGIGVMKNADLLVSRAGATTLTEIAAIGIASILIPSPYVPNNHQYHNAMALVNNEAALIIEEKNLNAENLKNEIDRLMKDDELRQKLADNATKLGNSHVCEDIIEKLECL